MTQSYGSKPDVLAPAGQPVAAVSFFAGGIFFIARPSL